MNDDVSQLKTEVVFKDEARTKLFKGLSIVAEAVSCTLGPRGKTVIIHKHDGAPVVTKDGVSVSKSIRLPDVIEGMGGDLIKQAADRTNDVAGDGTTTATVLTHAMVEAGLRSLGNGNNAQEMCKGIDFAVDAIVSQLRSDAKTVTTPEELVQVATISANGDVKIGQLVAAALEKVGRDGIITVEDAKGTNTSLEVVEGLQFERGYLSPYFVTHNDKMHATYTDVRVLITDKKLSALQPLIPILEKAHRAQVPLLIIADDVEGEALNALVLNRVRGNMAVVAIKAPGYGQHRDELLSDLCSLTSAELVSSKTGVSLEKLEFTSLGFCKKIVVDAKTTTLVADGKTSDNVKKKVDELRTQLEDVTLTTDDVVKLRSRIAALSSGVAVVKVGGATEVEMIERKHRIEDALHATRAAAEEGIVPGGGMALLQASLKIDESAPNDDLKVGVSIVVKACQAPLRRIVQNAGGSPDVVINRATSVVGGQGYDAMSESFKDMFEAGIVDPLKVCRSALQHAASVAKTFLTLDAVVYTVKND
jgi:chaperonin GroEL